MTHLLSAIAITVSADDIAAGRLFTANLSPRVTARIVHFDKGGVMQPFTFQFSGRAYAQERQAR
jgi:hypothetical protein